MPCRAPGPILKEIVHKNTNWPDRDENCWSHAKSDEKRNGRTDGERWTISPVVDMSKKVTYLGEPVCAVSRGCKLIQPDLVLHEQLSCGSTHDSVVCDAIACIREHSTTDIQHTVLKADIITEHTAISTCTNPWIIANVTQLVSHHSVVLRYSQLGHMTVANFNRCTSWLWMHNARQVQALAAVINRVYLRVKTRSWVYWYINARYTYCTYSWSVTLYTMYMHSW